MAFIELRQLSKIFGPNPRQALAAVRAGMSKEALLEKTRHTLGLKDVTLSIERGEIFVVMGLSGSGKSTLIRHINRLIDPTDGAVEIDGVDVLGLSIPALTRFRRETMSMVFQRFGLFPHRTVLENVAYGLEVRGLGRREREKIAMRWIEAVGLAGFEHQHPGQLSGGMQQRVGLARALSTDPEILLMDEAFSALDPLIRSQMQDQLIALQAELRKTIVFITHDLDEALRLGDRIAILKDGAVVQVGTPAEILLHPADAYVRAFVKDVNRARVLTVDTVMKPPELRLTDENLERALAEMQRLSQDYGVVVEGQSYRGIVTQDAVERAIERRNGAGQVADIAVAHPAMQADAKLEAALPRALESPLPIVVVDASGHLKGVVSAAEMGQVLAPANDADAVRLAGPPPLGKEESGADGSTGQRRGSG